MANNYVGREAIDLPIAVANDIIQKTQEQSAVMQLARQITLPGTGVMVPVILSDPEADWVAEGAEKPVKTGTLETKKLVPYKLAVIVPFSMEFVRDREVLYNAMIQRIPLAMAAKFDGAVFGSSAAPGENFDTLSKCTAQVIGTNAYDGLVAADTDVSEHDGIVNGYVLAPQGKATLLASKDKNDRPLFINNIADNAIPTILGAPTYVAKAAHVTGTPETFGFVGDWTKSVYGTVQGMQMSVSDQATLKVGSETINLWQQNMVAVRAEIELGFRADTTVFNKLVKASA